ncbi:MAG: glycosyltransferase family 1 protein [Anaerolineales bacterium]
MKVGLITYGLDRPLTGIGRYTIELAKALSKLTDGPEITLLQAGSSGRLEEAVFNRVSLPGCRLLPGLMTLGNFYLPWLARRLNLDVIHDPNGVAPFLFGAGPAKTVLTLHDVFPWSFPGTSPLLEIIIYKHWLPMVIGRMNAVITPSQHSRTDILNYLTVSSKRLSVIHYGMTAGFHPLPKKEVKQHLAERFGWSAPYILYVGAIEPRKNIGRLIEAFADLAKEYPRMKLVLAGPRRGEQKSVDSVLTRRKVFDRVVFTGPIVELTELYNGCELFVFPSLYEGFGMPPLEAMACGAPVVCSDTSSLPEVVGDAACLVSPLDTRALAAAMREVLSNSRLRRGLRKKGLERSHAFSWERNAAETMDVYRKVVYH